MSSCLTPPSIRYQLFSLFLNNHATSTRSSPPAPRFDHPPINPSLRSLFVSHFHKQYSNIPFSYLSFITIQFSICHSLFRHFLFALLLSTPPPPPSLSLTFSLSCGQPAFIPFVFILAILFFLLLLFLLCFVPHISDLYLSVRFLLYSTPSTTGSSTTKIFI